MEERFIQTKVPGIYRDIKTKALIIKDDPIHKQLIRKIYELEERIKKLEEKINNKDGL